MKQWAQESTHAPQQFQQIERGETALSKADRRHRTWYPHTMQTNWSVRECRRVHLFLLTTTEQTRGQCCAAAETKFGRIDSAIKDQGGDSVH
jgi:hypothetical protein